MASSNYSLEIQTRNLIATASNGINDKQVVGSALLSSVYVPILRGSPREEFIAFVLPGAKAPLVTFTITIHTSAQSPSHLSSCIKDGELKLLHLWVPQSATATHGLCFLEQAGLLRSCCCCIGRHSVRNLLKPDG